MTLQPDDNWCWYYDEKQQRMMLDLTEGLHFRSRFSKKMLTPEAFESPGFCVEDAARFYTFEEKCRDLDCSHQQRAELVLNAVVAGRFLKPLMPKSWYFTALQPAWQPENGQLVEALLSDTQQSVRFLVAESGDSATLCVLAQARTEMAGKTLLLGDAIKIMNDRLQAYQPSAALALDQVG